MKYSRDIAREKDDDTTFNAEIERQVKYISETNATHVAVGTPYDPEFIPFLQRWVDAARKHNLNVWFRGNFAGWEQWFEYDAITRTEHLVKLNDFIVENPQLFKDGDILTTCTECENGGPGDPRITGDVNGHRKFLIEEYKVASNAFKKINKNVNSNYFSMNGDVANLVMDRQTTAALDSIVVIDHYVSTPEKLAKDISQLAQKSGGKIILGEFGAPIPDIHGALNEKAQAMWIEKALEKISKEENLIGVNYWLLKGGTTSLVSDENKEKEVFEVISQFFKPKVFNGKIIDQFGIPVKGALIVSARATSRSNASGIFTHPVVNRSEALTVTAEKFKTNMTTTSSETIVLQREEDLSYMMALINKIFQKLRSIGI